MTETILVTGGCGFIGSHIADRLLDDGYKVLVIDDMSTGNHTNLSADADFRQGSVVDRDFIETLFNEFTIDGIIHEASHINANVMTEDPKLDIATNVFGTINLIEMALQHHIEKFVFASSTAIYGHFVPFPANEDGPIKPVHSYGIAKLCAEQYIRYYGQTHGFKANIARYGNIYGPRQPIYGEVGVIAIFTEKVVKLQPLTIFGDGEHLRDYLYIEDAVEATIQLLNFPGSETFNVASGQGTSVNQVFELLNKSAGNFLQQINKPERVGEFREFYADTGKIANMLDWSPKIGLAEGIEKTLNHCRRQV
jgi:UDP-glucose 4-epimerase